LLEAIEDIRRRDRALRDTGGTLDSTAVDGDTAALRTS